MLKSPDFNTLLPLCEIIIFKTSSIGSVSYGTREDRPKPLVRKLITQDWHMTNHGIGMSLSISLTKHIRF